MAPQRSEPWGPGRRGVLGAARGPELVLVRSPLSRSPSVGDLQWVKGRLVGISGLNSTPKPGVSGTRIFPFSGTGSPSNIGENIGTISSAVGCIIKNSENGLLVRVMTKWY